MTILAGGTILVTGASRGIGAAIAARLSDAGADLIRLSRSACPQLPRAVDYAVDLADPRARSATLTKVTQLHGCPDAVVSNAGIFAMAPLEQTSDEMLRGQMAINLEAPLAIAREFLPRMRQRGSGHHVLIGSIADHRGFAGNAAYSASKFGLRGLHEVLCAEFAGTGVHCTMISPAATDTAIWDNADATGTAARRQNMLQPDDVADAVMQVLTAPARVHYRTVRMEPG